MRTSAQTQLNMVIGYPLTHTQSPLLHSLIYEKLEIDAKFLAIPTKNLAKSIEAIRTFNVGLTAVALPFKQTVINFLDEVSLEAKAIGAVNTIINRNETLYGYNTDLLGIAYALRDTVLENKTILVLGAGGAACPAGYWLQKQKAQILWCNRTQEKALALAKRFGGDVIEHDIIQKYKIDVIINATSVGMYPLIDASPLSGYVFNKDQIVCDMVYHPYKTQLLKDAEKKGAKVITGLTMLIAQGVEQDSLWLDRNIASPTLTASIKEFLIAALTSQLLLQKGFFKELSVGLPLTALIILYWKNRAKDPDFWDPVYHGKANRIKPLFKDEFMSLFLTPGGIDSAIQMFNPILALALAVRHKYFLKIISTLVKNKVNPLKQVVLLGSGFDTTPVRKKKYDVKFFEIDTPPVLFYKKKIYADKKINQNAVYISIDYIKDNLIDALKKANLNPNIPTHFIWEGNTMYLSSNEVEKVLNNIKDFFNGSVSISFDYLGNEALQNNAVKEIQDMRTHFQQVQAPMRNGYSDIQKELVSKLKWNLDENISVSALTQQYGVGDTPYVSQKNYFVCTLSHSKMIFQNYVSCQNKPELTL